MSGKMKKLICALLSGTMILGSVGLVGFAADDAAATTDTAVAATTAPEAETAATEAPAASNEKAEATPAASNEQAPAQKPAQTGTAYDNDAYYQKALALCQGLGIITGYEDGSVKPDSTVTRAEMSAIILRMLANNTSSTYQNIFTDVASSHWAANIIQTASALGIVNGMGDGTFVPDGNVQYEQVAKMIVCAMNYNDTADYYGGYPNGFLKVASDLNITKNAAGNTGVAADRGVVIKMVYNALLADYNEPDGTEYGQQKFKAERSLAEYAFDVKEERGILLGTATTTLTGKDVLDGQVAIKTTGEDDVKTYNTELKGLDDYLASNITFYYEEQNSGDDRVLLAVAENAAKTTSVTLSNDDIGELETFEGFDGSKGEIKVYDKPKYKLSSAIEVVYNGTLITSEDFEKAKAAAKADDPRFAGKEYIDFLKPEVGTIRLVENNDEQDGYDIAFIDSYETLLVSSATAKKVIAKINNVSTTIDVDEDANDITIATTIKGMEAAPRNLKKNDVVSLKRSLDGETLEFVAPGESVTGTIKSISTDDGKTYATINGTEYEVDANAVSDCKMGTQAVFYMDNFNRIGYIETVTASGMLQSGENYGWIMSIYDSDDGEDTLVKLYNQEGKSVEAALGSSVDYWAPTADEPEKLSGDKVKTEIEKLKTSTNFIQMGTTPIKLVKYKLNGSNEITRLYCAVDASKVDDESALRIDPTNQKSVAALNGAVNGYNISDGILEFSIPNSAADMKSASNYSVGEVAAANYVVRENGSTRDFVIGEFKNSINANIVLNFTASGSAAAAFTDMDSANSGPSVMVVDSIAEGYDSDNDMPLYEISGYTGGSKVSVTTNKNTNVGVFESQSIWSSSNNGRNYAPTSVWTAKDSKDSLSDYISKGDIILYTTDGKLIARYASAENDIKFTDGEVSSLPVTLGNNANKSTSRVAYYFNKVLDHDLTDVAFVKLEGVTNNIIFDPSMAIDVVTISSGRVNIEREAASVSEIENGDYMFVNYADKGSTIKSMIVYRVEE